MSKFFVWDKNRSQKSIGSFLLLLMFGICFTQGSCYFSSNSILNKPNNVCIENIENDKTVKLGYNSLLAKDNEILLSKESCNGNFHYDFFSQINMHFGRYLFFGSVHKN